MFCTSTETFSVKKITINPLKCILGICCWEGLKLLYTCQNWPFGKNLKISWNWHVELSLSVVLFFFITLELIININ